MKTDPNSCNYLCEYPSPMGVITLSSNGMALTGLWLEGQHSFDELPAKRLLQANDLPTFAQTHRWLTLYFQGIIPNFTPPLSMPSSPFRMAVWELLRTIPYGTTMTYGEIAKEMATRLGIPKMSAQAVGGAVGHNPIFIIIPCHRVVGAGGNLTGYAGGIEKKIQLLTLEKVDMSGFFIPKKGAACQS